MLRLTYQQDYAKHQPNISSKHQLTINAKLHRKGQIIIRFCTAPRDTKLSVC